MLRLVKTKAHNVIRIELLKSALFSVGAHSLLSSICIPPINVNGSYSQTRRASQTPTYATPFHHNKQGGLILSVPDSGLSENLCK